MDFPNYFSFILQRGLNAINVLNPFVIQTVIFKSTFLQNTVAELADKIGQAPDTLLYVLILFAAYPLSLLVGVLPSKLLRHLFFGIGGIIMMQIMYGADWIHSLITIMGTYMLMKILPWRIMPASVFVFLMTYLGFSHLYRMYVDYMGMTVDFTRSQMVLCIKLTSLAYNIYDGKIGNAKLEKILRAQKELDSTSEKSRRKINALEKILASQAKYAIHRPPNFLEYLGYCYCFPTIMAGPAFEYTDYITTVDGSIFKKKGPSQELPGTVLPALTQLAIGILCLLGFVMGSATFPIQTIAKAPFFKKTLLYRCLYAWVAMLIVRLKYYFAWKVAEGACIMAGFGFEGYNENGSNKGWNGVSNIDILGVELAGNASQATRSWNKRTQGWLERYVYNRTNRSLLAVYTVSAVWHGFYPGYYFSFLSMPLLTEASRVTKTNLRPYFSKGSLLHIYNLFALVLTSIHINYLITSFQLLSWDSSIKCFGGFYFGGHLSLLLVYIVCMNIPPKR